MTPDERAQKSAEALWESDAAAKWTGIRIDEVTEAKAVLSLEVADHHCNGHGMCHGGVIYMLADTAFAYACNSRNQATVAQNNTITYVSPAQRGDTLTAIANEKSLKGKNGIYDIEVSNQNADIIAQFRGCSRTIKGHLFEE
jgi:acyl-CoA thioesterase